MHMTQGSKEEVEEKQQQQQHQHHQHHCHHHHQHHHSFLLLLLLVIIISISISIIMFIETDTVSFIIFVTQTIIIIVIIIIIGVVADADDADADDAGADDVDADHAAAAAAAAADDDDDDDDDDESKGWVVEEEPEEEEEDKGRREREVIGLITANESEEGEEEEEEGGRGLTQQAFSSSLSSLSSPSLSSVSPSPDSRKLAFRHGWRVGEAVLRCMEVLLGKCPCDSANKLVFLLPSLMKAAALAREEASEEFRHSAVRCLKELLRGLHPPRVSGHMEGQEAREGVCTSDDSDDDGDGDRHMVGSGMGRIDRSDCPVAALCSEVMGITVGSLVDLLLKIDEAEVAAGSAGSKSLRTDALGTLRCLVLKLDDGDALAYFLPAMSVRLARASLSHIQGKDGRLVAVASAQTKKVGAAWSSAAVREAVSLLGDLLVLILGDTRNTGALMPAKSVRTASGSQQADKTAEEGTVDTVDSALQALRELKMQFGSKEAAADGERDGGGGKESSSSSEVKRKGEEVAKEMPVFDGNFRKLVLRVDRNEQWLSETASKLHVLISRCFPLVSLHPSPKVRLALGDTSCRLLTECRLTLKDTVPILLDCLLGLVYDDFPQVSSPMIKVISSVRVVAGGIAEGTNAKGNQDRIPKASTAANRSKQLSIDQEIIESTLQRLVADNGTPCSL
ncbi:hypothetical protein CBR_g39748 [Chara braunii]|uniref:TTI1 N-terminal TPR domain-containing protein n=1 Tax=Chara braunii TaxID=69332 RepID=A0A388LSK1_CHABU|nr:hypothetical protein CBR_g39748 [Chara braunii]|eukprot:GBG85183.1 hypothetical protein CBR_g39748 [Chara braunii]